MISVADQSVLYPHGPIVRQVMTNLRWRFLSLQNGSPDTIIRSLNERVQLLEAENRRVIVRTRSMSVIEAAEKWKMHCILSLRQLPICESAVCGPTEPDINSDDDCYNERCRGSVWSHWLVFIDEFYLSMAILVFLCFDLKRAVIFINITLFLLFSI